MARLRIPPLAPHVTSDDWRLTEFSGAGLYSREELALLGRLAFATGAITPDP